MTISKLLKKSSIGEHLVRRPPLMYAQKRHTLARSNATATLEARKAASNRRLKEIIAIARKTPYYQSARYAGDFWTWPFLSKEDVRDNMAAFDAPSRLPPIHASTSGTTGTPLELRRSWSSVIAEQAAIDDLVAMAGIDFASARVVQLRGDSIKDPTDLTPPFWTMFSSGKRLAMSSLHLSRKTLSHYLEALREFDPDVFWVYPSSLEVLLGLLEANDLVLPSLKLVLASSDVLTDETRVKAEQYFKVPIYDYYGQSERVNIAVSTERDKYYFWPSYAVNELIYSHSDERQDFYEIIGTSLLNTAQIFARYRTGDYALLPKSLSPIEIEEICYGVRPFTGVAGRINDYLVTPEGAHLVGLPQISWGMTTVIQYQFIQPAVDHVRMLVVPSNNFTEADQERLTRQARQKIPRSIKLDVELVEQVQLTKQGKAPFVIRAPGIA